MPNFFQSLFQRRGQKPGKTPSATPSQRPVLDPRSDEFRAIATGQRTPQTQTQRYPATSYMAPYQLRPQMPRVTATAVTTQPAQVMMAGGRLVGPSPVTKPSDLNRFRERILQMESEGNLEGLENSARMDELASLRTMIRWMDSNGMQNLPETYWMTGRPAQEGETAFLFDRQGRQRAISNLRPEDQAFLMHFAEDYYNNPVGTGKISDIVDRATNWSPVADAVGRMLKPLANLAVFGWGFFKHVTPTAWWTFFRRGVTQEGIVLTEEDRMAILAGGGYVSEPTTKREMPEAIKEHIETFGYDYAQLWEAAKGFVPAATTLYAETFSEDRKDIVPPEVPPTVRGYAINALAENRLDDVHDFYTRLGLSNEEAQEWIDMAVAVRDGPQQAVEDLQVSIDAYNRFVTTPSPYATQEEHVRAHDRLLQEIIDGVDTWRKAPDPYFATRGQGGWRVSYRLEDGQERWDADNRNIAEWILQRGRLPQPYQMRQITAINADAGLEFAWEATTDVLNFVPIPFLDDLIRISGRGIKWAARGAWGMAEATPVIGRVFRGASSFFGGMAHRSAAFVWGRSLAGRFLTGISRTVDNNSEFVDVIRMGITGELDETGRMSHRITRGLLEKITGEQGLLSVLSTPSKPFTIDDLIRTVEAGADDAFEARRAYLRRAAGGAITPEIEARATRLAQQWADDPRNIIHHITLRLEQSYLDARRLAGLGRQYLDEGMIAWIYHATDEMAVVGRLGRELRELGLTEVSARQLYRDFVENVPDLYVRHGVPDAAIGSLEALMRVPGTKVSSMVRFAVGVQSIYKGFMSFWTTAILTARPSFVIYNWLDTAFRAMLYGANPFMGLDDIVKRLDELGSSLPEDIRMTLKESIFKGASLEDLGAAGKLPRNFMGWFQLGAREGMQTGKLGPISGFLGGMGGIWSGTEFTWRARLYFKFYERDVAIVTRMLTGQLDRLIAEAGADATTAAILRELPIRLAGTDARDPAKLLEVIQLLTGRNAQGRVPLLIDPEMWGRLDGILQDDLARRRFASMLQQEVRRLIDAGGSPAEIREGIRVFLTDIIDGFESKMNSMDLQALRHMPPADVMPDPTRLQQAANAADDALAAGTLPEMAGPPPASTAPAHPGPLQNVAPEAPPAAAVPEAPAVGVIDEAAEAARQDLARAATEFDGDIVRLRQDGLTEDIASMSGSGEAATVRDKAQRAGEDAARTTFNLQERRNQLSAMRQAEDVGSAFFLSDLDVMVGRFSRAGQHREWLLQWARNAPYLRGSRSKAWRNFWAVVADEYAAQVKIMQEFLDMNPGQLRIAAESGILFTPERFLQEANYVLKFDEAGRLTQVSHPSGLFNASIDGSHSSTLNSFLNDIGCPLRSDEDVLSWMRTPYRIQTDPLTGARIPPEVAAEQVAAEVADTVRRATEPIPTPEIPTDPIERARHYEVPAKEQGLNPVYNNGAPGAVGEVGDEIQGHWATTQVGDAGNVQVTWLTDEQYEAGRRAAVVEDLRRGNTIQGYDPARPDVIPEEYRNIFIPEGSAAWEPIGTPPPTPAGGGELFEETIRIRREQVSREVWRDLMGMDAAGNPVGKPFMFGGRYSADFFYSNARLPDGRMATESFEAMADYLQMALQRAMDDRNWGVVEKLRGRIAELLDLWEPRYRTAAAKAGIPGVDPNVIRFRSPSLEMMDPNVVAWLRATDEREGMLAQLRAWSDDFAERIEPRIAAEDTMFRQLSDEQKRLVDDIGRRYADMLVEGEDVIINGGEFLGKNFEGAVNATNRIALNYRDFSPFDRAMKQAIPFWMFPSRSIPFWVETMVHHPELVGWYLRYMSNTSMVVWQHGFVNSRGEPLPSMRGLIPLGNGMWWNPTGPLSFRYVFPTLDYWDAQEMSSNNMTFAEQATAIAFKTLSMAGSSPAPWVPLLFRSANALPVDIYQPQGLLPQAALIPPFANALLKRSARQTTWGRVAVEVLDPDVSYIDFLVNRQLLIDGLEEINNPNLTDADRWLIIDEVQNAIDMYTRGQNPAAEARWNRAYGHIQTDDWLTSTIGYFTGMYPRMHTDADAQLIQTRMDINMLYQAINKEMGTRIFPMDLDIDQIWDFVKTQRYEVPENYLATLYTSFSWVRVPSGSEPYDPSRESPDDYYRRISRVSSSYDNVSGMGYNVIVGFNIESQRQRQEYNAERDRIRAERDAALQNLPLGTSGIITSEIYRRYGEEIADMETRYPLAPRDWVIGYKPEQLVFEDFRNLWWYTLLDTAPQWDPAKYESYDNFQADYNRWLERLPQIAAPMMRDIQTKFAEAQFFDPSMNRPEELCMRLIQETTAEGLEQWRIGNDDLYSALNHVWVNNYQSPYYAAVGKATSTEGRELAERNFLRQFGPDGRPTEDQIIQWVQARYGDRFSREEILGGLYGRGIMSMMDRQEQNAEQRVGEAAAATDDRLWEMLNRIPPGTEFDNFLDTFRRNGGNDAWVDIFKATDSTNYWRSEDDVQRFEAILTRTLNQLGHNQPLGDDELGRRDQARNENTDFRRAVQGRLGEEFWTTLTWYMSLSSSERRDAREEDPTISEQIDLYYQMKENWGLTHPIWAQYYLEPTEEKKPAAGGGGGQRAAGGGQARRATAAALPPSQGFYLPLGYRGAAEGRELLKAGKKLGSGGAGGKLPWPKGFKEAAGETLIGEVEGMIGGGAKLSKAAERLLTILAQNQHFAPIVNTIMQINSGVQEA